MPVHSVGLNYSPGAGEGGLHRLDHGAGGSGEEQIESTGIQPK